MLSIILLTNLLSLSKVASLHTGTLMSIFVSTEVYDYPIISLPQFLECCLSLPVSSTFALINVQGAVFSKELDW